MALTYTYENGQISHFALKKVDGSCDIDPDRTTLVGVFCKQCPHYLGIHVWKFVICEHHKKDDPDPEASDARHKIYERIRHNALCALDY